MKKIKSYHITPIFSFVIFALVFASNYIKPQTENPLTAILTVLIIQIVIFIIPGFIYKRLQGQISYKSLGFRPIGLSSAIFIICTAIFLFCLSALISLSTGYDGNTYHESATFMGTLYEIIGYCLLPAITEEFAFRSIIYTEYRKYGILSAVILSSLLFSLMHFSYRNMLLYFIAGVILALVYEVTHSVFSSMAVHFLYNLMIVFSKNMIVEASSHADNVIPLVFVFTCVMLLSLFFALSRAQHMFEYDAKTIPAEKNTKFPDLQTRLRSFMMSVITPAYLSCIAFSLVVILIFLKST